MKIVIAGVGTTGRYLTKILLKDKHDLILIESNKRIYDSAKERFDAQIEFGDASDPTTLEPFIDESVDYFVALTDDDRVNIIATIIARRFGAQRVIARISNPNNLIHPLLTDDPHVHLLNAEMIVAKDLIRLIGTPSADDIELFAKGKAEMVTLHVEKDSEIIGKKLKDIKIPDSWLVVATIHEGNFTIASGDTEIKPDDQLLVVGDPNKYREIESFLDLSTPKVDRVVLVGYNEISSHVASSLNKKNIDVRLISNNPELAEEAAAELDGVLVFQGDATDEELLDQMGIEDSDHLIALTDDDETNVLISLLAKEKKVSKVITLTQKAHYRRVIQKIGIDSVVNPRSSLVDEIIRCIHHKDLLGINLIEGGQGRMMEFVVNKKTKLIEKPLSKVKLPKQILIGAIIRNDHLIIPRGDTRIKVGDHVVVFSTLSIVSEVKKLFGN